MKSDITVIIASHFPRYRSGLLTRAIDSVSRQTLLPDCVIIETDHSKESAPIVKQRALEKVTTKYFAVLDSDDMFLPNHLEALMGTLRENNADIVYSHYEVIGGGSDPRPFMLGKPYEDGDQITTVILADTQKVLATGGYTPSDPDMTHPHRQFSAEDFELSQRCNQAGLKIVHHPEITWQWDHGGTDRNTSGLAKNW